MSLDVGDTLIVRVEPERTTLTSVERTVARFQALLAERVPPGYSAVDELISEREGASLLVVHEDHWANSLSSNPV